MDTLDDRSVSPELENLYQTINKEVHRYLQRRSKRSEKEPQLLERKGNIILSTADYLKKKLYTQAAHTFRQQNAFAPIHRLPTEILVAIFTEDLATQMESIEHYHRLQTLCQVSYSWWRLILGNPSFWTIVSSTMPIALVEEALSKSLSYPLRVSGDSIYPSSTHFPTFFQKVCQHASRWQSLRISTSRDTNLDDYFVEPASRLKTLVIRFTTALDEVAFVSKLLEGGALEGLRELSFHYGVIDGTWEHLTNLQKLQLSFIPKYSLSYAQLSRIIKSSPSLHTLIIDAVALGSSNSRPATQMAMELPLLRKLHVTKMSLEDIHFVLREINAPNCDHVQLTEIYDHNDAATGESWFMDESMSYLRSPMQRILQRTDVARISCIYRGFLLSAYPPVTNSHKDQALVLSTHSFRSVRMLSWLAGGLEARGIPCPVFLEVSFGALGDDIPLSFLSLLPTTTSLEFNPGSSLDPVFQFLSQAVTSNGVDTWPLPNLVDLRVNMEHSSFTRFYDMLKKRYGKDLGNGDAAEEEKEVSSPEAVEGTSCGASHASRKSQAVRPAALTSLTLRGATYVGQVMIDEIEDLLGEGVVNNHLEGSQDSEVGDYDNLSMDNMNDNELPEPIYVHNGW